MNRIILPLDFFLLGATSFPTCDNERTTIELLNSDSSLSATATPDNSINEP